MPDVTINIGGRGFEVACQQGEEHFLQAAAALLNNEAVVLNEQIGRLPEARMLLMAGLMLADKTAGMEEELRDLRERLARTQKDLNRVQNAAEAADPEAADRLVALAERAERLADAVEAKAAAVPE